MNTIDLSNGYNQTALIAIVVYAVLVFILSKSPRLLNTIPSFSAGIGVLLTFWVLYENLKAFDPPQGDDVFLKTLVQELSAAFSTSIIGVTGSFIFNFLVKWRIDQLERKGYKGEDYFKKHPHELLHEIRVSNDDIRKEIINLRGRNQEATLENIVDSVNSLTNDAIGKLERLFTDLDQRLQKTIEALGSNAIQDAQQTVVDVNRVFTDQTSALLAKNLEEIASFFASHKELIGQTANQFAEHNKNLQHDIAQTKNDFEEKIAEVKSAFATGVGQMADKYEQEALKLSELFNEVKSTLTGIDKDIQSSTQSILEAHLEKLDVAFERIHDFQLSAQNNLQQTTTEFGKAVEQYQTVSNNQGKILEVIKTQLEEIENMRERSGELLDGWQAFSNEIQKLEHRVADIANTVAQLDDIHSYLNGRTVNT